MQKSPYEIQSSNERNDVDCLTYFESGFCYSIRNSLYVFEKEKSYVRYTKKTLITIPVKLFAEPLFSITNVSVNALMDTVIVTAKHSQIYIAKLFEPGAVRVIELQFRMLGEPLHVNGIICMSVCSWKPIIMTAGYYYCCYSNAAGFLLNILFPFIPQPRTKRSEFGIIKRGASNWSRNF